MFRNILLAVDLDSEESWARALPEALSAASPGQSELTVLSVVPEVSTVVAQAASFTPLSETNSERWVDNLFRMAGEKLGTFVAEHVPATQPVETVVRSGTVYREILEVAAERSCDLIIIGSHRPELKDYLIGPNAARVVRHATCSVLVVRR